MSVVTKIVLTILTPSALVMLLGAAATPRFGSAPVAQVVTGVLTLATVILSSVIATRRLISGRLDALADRVHAIDAARPDAAETHEIDADSDAETVLERRGDEIERLGHAIDASLDHWSAERDVMKGFARCQERELAEMRVKLAHEARRADASEFTKREFLSNVSHEIRTPMNGIMGLCELLSSTPTDEDRREYIAGIQRCAESLMAVMNDILDFTRLVAGDLTVDPIPCDLASAMQEVVDHHAKRAREKDVDVRLVYDPIAPRHLLVDAARLRQLVSLLVSNAVKFTDEGSVTVSIGALRVTDTDARMRISIEDTGIGIQRHELESIFETFRQVDSSLSRRHGGTGMGLAVCRRLAELLGGAIEVESSPGEGSRFSFIATFAAAPSSGGDALVFADPTNVRLLLVDDDPVNRRVMQKRLARWSIRAHILADPTEVLGAMHEARRAGDPFEICLIDYQMPQMTGGDLAKAIRSDPDVGRVPLVLLTSKSSRGDARRMRDIGFVGYLVKPLAGDMMRDAISAALGSARSGTSAFITQHALAEHRTATGEGRVTDATTFRGNVLVAEDNPINQMLARRLLEKMGVTVDVAPNGQVALERVESHGYDLVFMDCQMPVMDGIEATERIRASGVSAARVPIVAMTANALQEEKARCLAAGMDDFITKPVDVAMLRAVIARYLTADDGSMGDDEGERDAA